MLAQCWATVCDAGPTVLQCLVFAGTLILHRTFTSPIWTSIGTMSRVCWEAGYSDQRLVMSRRDGVLMLTQRLWHWPHIRPTLVLRRRRLWAQQTQYITLSTCWISAGPTSKMLAQPQPCIGPTLHQNSTTFWDLPDVSVQYIRTLP